MNLSLTPSLNRQTRPSALPANRKETATLAQGKSAVSQPQFGMGPIFNKGDEKIIIGFLAACVGAIGLAGAGVGYLVSQSTSKKEPETIQTPVKTTADEVKSLQEQLDAKKAKLQQEQLDLKAQLKALIDAEKQLKP